MKMNPVVHFEMPFKDKKRVTDFYSKVFGWSMQQMGADMGEYVLAQTTETDKGMVKTPGNINGGFFKLPEEKEDQVPSVVIAVDDIKAHMKLVTESGGKVIGEPSMIPNVGWYVSFRDSEGNRVSLLQPTRM